MPNRALQIIANVLRSVLGPDAAEISARRIVDALDREADVPVLAVDDVVQVAHTSPICRGELAHIQTFLPDGNVKIRMPAGNGNHGFAILALEYLVPTGGSIAPASAADGGFDARR